MKFTLLLVVIAAGDIAEVASPWAGIILKYGALGVLTWVVVSLNRERIRDRESHGSIIDRLCDRWDKAEETRHDDSERLNDTLRSMTQHCAERSHG
jgi:hypothetical protein